MKTVTKEKVVEFGANLAQITIWVGVAYALVNPAILPFALPVFLSKEVLGTTVGALTGNKFGELVAKLTKVFQGKNQELDKIIKKALKNTFPALERNLLEHYNESNDESQSAISSLIAHYINIDFINFDITQQTNYELVKNFANSFEYLLATPFEDWKDKYIKESSLPENFEKVFVERFIVVFVDKLHDQLTNEDHKKAFVEYTLSLLELSIELNRKNQELLFQAHEILSTLKSNTDVLTGYTKDILNLNELLLQLIPSVSRQISDIRTEILSEINKQNQPDLLVPSIDTYKRDAYDFRYKAQYTTFLGRELEIDSLRKFALTNKADKNFYWWYLTGKGGSGKSRIAYELCIQLKLWDFYAGFIEKSLLENTQLWHKWMPVRNTFIVIDYANEKSDLIVELLKILESRQSLFKYSVRVLLIDRELTKEIIEKFSIEIEVENSSYTNDLSPIVLSDASDDILWGIIQEVHLKKEKNIAYEKKELLMYLYNIDNLKRPLFAFLAGVALVEGDDIRGWNKSELLGKLIVREENKVWNLNKVEKPIYEKHKTLLVIAKGCIANCRLS